MPKISFDQMTIKNIKPAKKSVEYFETGRNQGDGAFGIRISPKGKRTWFIMYKSKTGNVKRYSLGTFPETSLKSARTLATNAMSMVNKGNDPMGAKQAKRSAPTIKDLWDAYQKNLSQKTNKKAPSTVHEEHRRWNTIISPAIGHRKVEDITPMDISTLLDKVAETAPVSANRLHTLLKIMFKVALGKGMIVVHPMQWLDKPGGSEPPRKRVLTDDEIRALWPCFDKVRPNPRDLLKLGLLTAQRPGEILSMKWEYIDFKKDIWRQENTKNGSTNLVPLSPQVMSILSNRVPVDDNVNGWVFSSANNGKKVISTKYARKKLKELSGVEDWTAHDLRRTARTIMSRLKIKQHIRERVLNHAQGGVQGVYDQHDYLQEKADALKKLGREIDRILGVEAKGKIIELKTAI